MGSKNSKKSKDLKDKIVKEVVSLADFEGWSEEILDAAFENLKVDAAMKDAMFANGIMDVMDEFAAKINEEMLDGIKKFDLKNMRVRDKIKESVKLRLKIMMKNELAVKRMISFCMNHPKYFVRSVSGAYGVADLIWSGVGDMSDDYNFYTKRIILAKIYIKVMMRFVSDNSEDHEKTYQTLDEQIEKVMKFGKLKAKVKEKISCDKDAIKKLIKEFSNPLNMVKKLPFIRLFVR